MSTARKNRPFAVGQVYRVDPSTLTVGANVRADTRADAKDFAASIRARGVLEPITCSVADDGTLVVLRGQRRTLAAAAHGTPDGLVPVLIAPAPTEADRIIDQLTENVHRAQMRPGEERDAVEQLALLGISPAQITKRAALPRRVVDAALTVSATESARVRMDAEALTLDQAVVFAEFDGDDAAIEELERVIAWGRPLEHTAQRLRDRGIERQALLAEIERLRGEGLPVLDPEQVPDDAWRLEIADLVDDAGAAIPEAAWPGVTGAAVVVRSEWDWPETDGATEDEDAEQVLTYRTTWICTDPAAAGLHHPHATPKDDTTGRPSEVEQQAKADTRRLVIANNQAWRSAETVRRKWLAGFVTRRGAPAGAEQLICEVVLTGPYWMTRAMNDRHPLLRTLLGGVEESDPFAGTAECSRLANTATTKAATLRSLAAVLAAWDASTGVHTWRTPGAWDARILTAMTGWGYRPSDVEQLLLPDSSAPSADTAAPTDAA